MDLGLNNKTAIITGASRGIGLDIACMLEKNGCNLIINSKTQKNLKKIKNKFKENTHFICADTSKPKDVNKMIKQIKRNKKKIDILVCNVGLSAGVNHGKENYAEWLKMFKSNFLVTTNVIETLIKNFNNLRGLKIICISSIAGHFVTNAPIAYSVAKASINTYVKNIGQILAKKGITINAISPGNIFSKNGTWDKKIKKNKKKVIDFIYKNVPMNTLGSTRDVASLTCYLCSEYSNFITGSIFVVDGGQNKSYF